MDFALAAVCLVIGFIAGRLSKSAPPPPWKRGKLGVTVTDFLTVAPGHKIKFLSVEGPKALAVCARIVAGRPMTYRTMTGPGKLLSRGQWDKLRRELLDPRHQFCRRDRRGGLSPTPTGIGLAQNVLHVARAARTRTTKEIKNGNV